jgi:hypothetical protein
MDYNFPDAGLSTRKQNTDKVNLHPVIQKIGPPSGKKKEN